MKREHRGWKLVVLAAAMAFMPVAVSWGADAAGPTAQDYQNLQQKYRQVQRQLANVSKDVAAIKSTEATLKQQEAAIKKQQAALKKQQAKLKAAQVKVNAPPSDDPPPLCCPTSFSGETNSMSNWPLRNCAAVWRR